MNSEELEELFIMSDELNSHNQVSQVVWARSRGEQATS